VVSPTTSAEEYRKFIRSINEQIDAADKRLRAHAESEINTNISLYAKSLSSAITTELDSMEKALEYKKYGEAEYHKMMAGIYKSALEAILRKG
jgi:hypothetical protein